MDITINALLVAVLILGIPSLVFNERFKNGVGNTWLVFQSASLLLGMYGYVALPESIRILAIVMLLLSLSLSLGGANIVMRQPGPNRFTKPLFPGLKDTKL